MVDEWPLVALSGVSIGLRNGPFSSFQDGSSSVASLHARLSSPGYCLLCLTRPSLTVSSVSFVSFTASWNGL